ncbi:hypothetical protein JSQ81_00230 [Sporosarcina sp. Marseille-Q4063]|uniref:hypothetical protein n=1 Tax=Sporosarcina sp. Marseille-Q4063 TaxID=2810514 RepID=UPI001BB06A14|nr:hypothetical protein [Sporosarcina sp. Marseille-Q4063]QUW22057.1 hypothetical protein JSQ81_00230 [Sporosarcina sp. Marseille-Q4063]
MKQAKYGLLLFIFLAIPPVANLLESIMIIHMHMQMPLLIIAGFFMAKFLIIRFPGFFEKWNQNGIPGILLFLVILLYWMIPRTMDEALTLNSIEIFKFISLPFLAGVPLRDSWRKLSIFKRNILLIVITIMSFGLGLLYVKSPVQLCNNYLLIEQITLGWGFLTMAICLVIYLLYISFTDQSAYE